MLSKLISTAKKKYTLAQARKIIRSKDMLKVLAELRPCLADPRYRPSVYAKKEIMEYVEALVEWGDELFGRNTFENITEASAGDHAVAHFPDKKPWLTADRGAKVAVFQQYNKKYVCCPKNNNYVVVEVKKGLEHVTDIKANKDELSFMHNMLSGADISYKKHFIKSIQEILHK